MQSSHLFTTLQSANDDQIIGVDALAVQLNTTPRVIYKLHSTAPKKLPPRVTVFGRKLAWRLGTVRKWVRELDESDMVQVTIPTRTGRPRTAHPKVGE